MKINTISQIAHYKSYKINKTQENKNNTNPQIQNSTTELNYIQGYYIPFEAQVDKGLERFFEFNKDKMPITVKKYVETLSNKKIITPLEAQYNAFAKLEEAKNIFDIKRFFPDEPLFQALRGTDTSKATRGIINLANSDKELFELYGTNILKSKEDFTVYLVKKTILESKTLDEINKDLENDLDEDFKAEFKSKSPNSKYIYSSTLKSLGIQTPAFEYQQSLRYTRDGYADAVGAKIQQGLQTFWDSLSIEERTARAKKSVNKFENWWNSISRSQKLDMIANEITALEMLKQFKKSEQKDTKSILQNSKNKIETKVTQREKKHVKVGSQDLKHDELFIKWATNNLKIFEARLSEAEKDSLHIKRMQRLTSRWLSLTPAEKTDYINKMKAGSEPLKYTMIDAWNHSSDLIIALSKHLKESQIYKTSDMLYSSQEFSEFQSKIMTEFWENNKELANKFGSQIISSQEKVKASITRGTFEELKKQIMRDKHQRMKELSKISNSKEIETQPAVIKDDKFIYIDEFKQAYLSIMNGNLKNIPANYMRDYFEFLKTFPKELVISWTKHLQGKPLTPADNINLEKILDRNMEGEFAKQNRALEAALAKIIYEHTGNTNIYRLSVSDLKTAINQLEKRVDVLHFYSKKLEEEFRIPVTKNININKKTIENLYNEYLQPLKDSDIDNIIHNYFKFDNDISKEEKDIAYNNLKNYIKQYGKSILIIFSEKSIMTPKVKFAFYQKFVDNMSDEIYDAPMSPYLKHLEDFEYENEIQKAKIAYTKKFSFLPKEFIHSYYPEIAQILRSKKNEIPIEIFTNGICKKRKDITDHGKIFIYDKTDLMIDSKLEALAMEKALADTLFEATNNVNVYTLGLESLCDNLEVLSMAKSYPSESKLCPETIENSEFTIIAKQKPNLVRIKQKYYEYMQYINEWKDSNIGQDKYDLEDLLYILNPEENLPQIDLKVANRMACYGLY